MMRQSLRFFAQRPGFGAIAVITLALGIGAPTATFSVVHAVLLRPLPFPEPDRVLSFRIDTRTPRGAAVEFDAVPVTTALDWAEATRTMSALAVFNDRALTLTTPEGPFHLTGIAASASVFDLLRVTPLAGRAFDASTRDTHQIVLSHETWQRFFGGSATTVGSSITMDGEPYRVVAVMPEEFHFPTPEAAFWIPMMIEPGGTRGMLLPAIARIAPGATRAAVVAEGQRFFDATGTREMSLTARTLQEQLVGGTERVLWVLMTAVALVSAISTANIALLLLVRGAAREREFSVRLALGAARGRLVRQLLFEGMMLGVAGGTAGILLAALLIDWLPSLAPVGMPRFQQASINPTVLGFAFPLTVGISLVFCVLSAGRSLSIDPLRALAGSGAETRLTNSATPRRRLRVLAAAELALTMVLLVGAGLMLVSFVRLVLVDQGFDSRGALAMQVTLPAARYPTAAARIAFLERLVERLRALDGVRVAGLATAMPNRQPTGRFDYNVEEVPAIPDPLTMQIAEVRMVSDGFVEAFGLRLRAGRAFRSEDGAGAEEVMVISESLARVHFPGVDPIGRILHSRTGNRHVVGVVGDVRPAVTLFEHSPAAYLPLRQETSVFDWQASVNVVVRGDDLERLRTSIRALVLSLDPEMPPFNVRTLDDEVSRLVAGPRFSASVLAVFASIALVLAAVGVYGVMSYLSGLRTREIGVRVALGATRGAVVRLIIRDGVVVIASGVAVGVIASVWLTQTLTGMLYEVQPTNPAALAAVVILLSSVALVAAYLPARRATSVNALEALRSD
jgi:putative ABC transport system permease protein